MNKFWAYVTAFGTLWGGLELTLGTFLHVLHVPKTGLMMTLLSIVLLIAQRQIFSARGSTICIGVVAACIKCLSPGGIILGPVIGILGEALFVELVLALNPRSAAAAIAGGGLTLVWAQIQSVIKIWFYYGQDFIDGLAKIVSKFFSVPWSAALGWGILGTFFGVIFVLGAIAGGIGWRLGRHAESELKNKEISDRGMETEAVEITAQEAADRSMAAIVSIHAGRKKREPDAQILRTRKVMCFFAIGSLAAQFSGDLLWSASALGIWLVALFCAARSVLKAIWWPKFWGITILVSLIFGLILAYDFSGSWHWQLGIEAAARMIIRGCYVFSLISWATRCLRTREFLTVWEKVHLPELGLALANAYELLPNWVDRMNHLVASRPGGLLNNLKYVRESLMTCLIDAARDVREQ